MISNLSNLDDSQFLTATSKSENILPLVEGSEYLPPTVQPDAPSTQITKVLLDEIPTEEISVPEELEMIPFSLSEIEPNNSRQQGHHLGDVMILDHFLIDGHVSGSDNVDFFKFRLKKETEVNLNLSGLSADADLYLLQKNGSEIASSRNGGNTDDSIVQTLVKGTYHVKVESFDGIDTEYDLDFLADGDPYEPNDDKPDDAQHAYNLGKFYEGDMQLIENADIGGDDTSDWFNIRLKEGTDVSIDLFGLNADADLYLWKGKNATSLIASSTNGGNSNESIVETLNNGIYKIEVRSYDGVLSENYSLKVTAGGDPYEPNNTLQQAYDVGNVVIGYYGSINKADIGEGDVYDFFQFTLLEKAEVNLKLSQLDADVDLYLLDKNGSEIAYSINAETFDESIEKILNPETYYVLVHSYDGILSENYFLEGWFDDPVLDPYEPNNTFEEAYDVGNVYIGDYASTNEADIGGGDISDFFQFNLLERAEFHVNLSQLDADVDLSLYDQNESSGHIASSTNGGTLDESIVETLDPGLYYVKVHSYDGILSENYFLEGWFDDPVLDPFEPNDTKGQAYNLGDVYIGNYASTNEADIGGGDSSDFFQFNLLERAEAHLNLSNLNGNADLYIWWGGLSIAIYPPIPTASSTNPGNSDESIVVTLNPGPYYIEVRSVDGILSENYFLEGWADLPAFRIDDIILPMGRIS